MMGFLNGLKEMFLTVMSNEKMMPSYLIIFTSCVIAASILLLFFREAPMASEKALLLILGGMMAKFQDMCAWYFNSSSGSAKKTDLMAAQVQKPNAQS